MTTTKHSEPLGASTPLGAQVSSQDIVRQSQSHCGGKIRSEEVDPEIGMPLNVVNVPIAASSGVKLRKTQNSENLVNVYQSRQIVRIRMYKME